MGELRLFHEEIFIVVDQWNNVKELVSNKVEDFFLGQLATPLRSLVLSSAKFEAFNSKNRHFSKFKKIYFPLRSYTQKAIFKTFCLAYLREAKFLHPLEEKFTQGEVSFIEERLPEITSNVPFRALEFARFLFSQCGNLDPSLAQYDRMKSINTCILKFGANLRDDLDINHCKLVKMKRTKEKSRQLNNCMRNFVFKIPFQLNTRATFFDRRNFFLEETTNLQYLILPVYDYMLEIVHSVHPAIFPKALDVVQQIKQLEAEDPNANFKSALGYMIEHTFKWWVQNSGKILLDRMIENVTVRQFCSTSDNTIDKQNNILYIPSISNYPAVDYVLVSHQNGLHEVALIQITQIERNGFTEKLMKISERIGFSRTSIQAYNGTNPMQAFGGNHAPFCDWFNYLKASGFTPENTKFSFCIFFQGEESMMTATPRFDLLFDCRRFGSTVANICIFLRESAPEGNLASPTARKRRSPPKRQKK